MKAKTVLSICVCPRVYFCRSEFSINFQPTTKRSTEKNRKRFREIEESVTHIYILFISFAIKHRIFFSFLMILNVAVCVFSFASILAFIVVETFHLLWLQRKIPCILWARSTFEPTFHIIISPKFDITNMHNYK